MSGKARDQFVRSRGLVFPGDIGFVSDDKPMAKLVKWFSRDKGEPKTEVNHVFLFACVTPTPIETAPVVESLAKGTVKRPFWENYEGRRVEIWRNTEISMAARMGIVAASSHYVGKEYGKLKIVTHALDHFFGGKYLFRRLCFLDDYPICSWLSGYCYKKGANVQLGVNYKWAQPDDQYDFVHRWSGQGWKLMRKMGVV